MKKILVFDLDGTLLDSLPDIRWALNTTLAEFGLPGHDLDRVRAMVGHGLTELVRQAVPAGRRQDDQVKPLVRRIKELYASVPFRDTRAYPGIRDLLTGLKAEGHILAVLTNKAETIASLIVPHFFPGIFDAVQGESPDLPRKPDPEALLGLLRRLAPRAGIDPADRAALCAAAMLTGDSEADITTACRAGVEAIGVAWGYRSPSDLTAAGATRIASDAAELRQLISPQQPAAAAPRQPLIRIENLSFAYWDPEAPEDHSQRTAEDLIVVFEDLSLDLPRGITSILGENGIGKSTLMLLAGGRFFPARGRVTIDGQDSGRFIDAHLDPAREEERNRLVSFVYQNMEFETDHTLGELLEATLDQARSLADPRRAAALASLDPGSLARSLDLGGSLGQRPQNLSKGELQRGIIALAVAYGSRILMMDEPVFALEERHKQLAFGFLRDWCRQSGTHLVYTAHDIHLCRDFADSMLLLFRDKSHLLGPVAEICTDANLEAAYRVPLDTLYRKESLYRDMLLGKARTE